MSIRHVLFLATRSIWHSRGRSLIIVLCLALTLWLPVTARLMLNQFQEELIARADATPLVIGSKGSSIDLALNALYFDTAPPENTVMGEVDYIAESGLAMPIPLHCTYRTQSVDGQPGAPIVGTSFEYFPFRNLQLAEGSGLSILGDCVLGGRVAERLNLGPGDTLLSAPENAFDLAGDYPLEMNVVGVLKPADSPDDNAVFVDIRTAWIIDGIGHGHQELADEKVGDEGVLLDRTDDQVTASAAVLPFTRITPDNVDSFHFHGLEETFPVSTVIAVPPTPKDRTLLLGRYQSDRREVAQCVKPTEVVDQLLKIVFRAEQLIWVGSMISILVMLLLMSLVILLSVRLRDDEIQTLQKIGASRATIVGLLTTEVSLLVVTGILISAIAAVGTDWLIAAKLRSLIF